MTNLPGDVQVEKRISARGREYTITRPAGAKPPGVAPTTQASSNDKEDFGIQVTWDTQGVLDWKPTTKTIQDTASISMYMLKKTSTSGDNIYCTLHIQNSEHYDYIFYDETGDYYPCNTWSSGSHTINFYSEKPNIRFATGS